MRVAGSSPVVRSIVSAPHVDRAAIERLLAPVPAVVSVGRVDPDASSPFADELAVVARARAERRAQFLTGRALARVALAELGVAAGSIGRSDRGAPEWPAGVVGSITHAGGWCAVAVAPEASARGLGIDLESTVTVLDEAVRARIATAGELDRAGRVVGGVDPALVLFSAKEAVFKAVHPIDGTWLEHADLEIRCDRASFEVSSRVPLPADVSGRWQAADGFVVTAARAG